MLFALAFAVVTSSLTLILATICFACKEKAREMIEASSMNWQLNIDNNGYVSQPVKSFLFLVRILHSILFIGTSTFHPRGITSTALTAAMNKFKHRIPENDELFEILSTVIFWSHVRRLAIKDMLSLAAKIEKIELKIKYVKDIFKSAKIKTGLLNYRSHREETITSQETLQVARYKVDMKVKSAHQALALEQILRYTPKLTLRIAQLRLVDSQFGLKSGELKRLITDYFAEKELEVLWEW